ncbi:TRAP transporter large permease subunit [Nostoc sp. CHAB 5844]|nr:TRAP transporter large permease subunit [Nostoc sp. CHAB 5844]
MEKLLKISKIIDTCTEFVGRFTSWLVLVMVILGVWNGAFGCVGAIALAAAKRQLTLSSLRQVCDTTVKITSMVVFILFGSTAFSLVFRGLNGDQFMYDVLANLPGGKVGFLVVSMTVVFILGFFIDFFEIAFIVIPLFVPVAQQLDIDLVWYGVVLGANLQKVLSAE